MSKRYKELECFVRSIMDHQSNYCTKQLSDEYCKQLMKMVQKLEINEKTMVPSLKIICKEIFADGVTFGHVLALLIFCIELDKHCKLCQYSWYSRDILVKIVSSILYDFNFSPPSNYSLKICNII